MANSTVDITLVVPIYNEEDCIRPFLERTLPVLERIGSYELLFCMDPCADATEAVVREAMAENPHIGLMVFSRRFGQPAAVTAGILSASGDTCAVIDVDLQDPPELLEDLHARLAEGYEVAYAKRRSRAGETAVKRLVSWVGYWVINRISDVAIPRNTGDFRIMTRRVVEQLRRLHERHGFLRGLVAFVGFRQAHVLYDRDERLAGDGHYNRYLGSLQIGFNGLVGFSTSLLSLTLYVGLFVTFMAALVILYMILTKIFSQIPYPIGLPSTLIAVLFMGGAQLVSIGVLGQYIGRIYEEVRDRPQYIVDRAENIPGYRAGKCGGCGREFEGGAEA